MQRWHLDSVHSSIQFSVRHMMVTNVRRTFRDFTLDIDFDPKHAELGHVDVTVQAASIDTGSSQRDAHLRSADFLDVETYPTLAFTSRFVESRGNGEYRLYGDATIRGRSRPMTFDLEYLGDTANMQGGRVAGFSAHARISRRDWGLTWNVGLEAGGVAVSDEIKVEVDLELVQSAVVPVAPELRAIAV